MSKQLNFGGVAQQEILSHNAVETELSEEEKSSRSQMAIPLYTQSLIPALGFSHMTFSIRDEFLPNRRPTIANWRITDHAARSVTP
ncbi:uncharacterized protein TRIVIDRAFT_215437 [Trichoderma virens Gv29-8]|uniref:Uncharacterized protein n=1 Tax=Hypocrea virens (strain Gv29-8 / FGSC 10586) TaxID=413071 RepID=G9MIY7_HYPVG|nr:uncharacterized protein TRIVIDRAFT_215437 [Trichoderma virens Gv29-8]EHK25453.1 hypothetical protein TRIVIDRAFT_215437 [Trichoderma virens Gv29-8]